jgi:predicted nucleic acid-binding protein
MATAIDTNILVTLLDGDVRWEAAALEALENASKAGGLMICGAVFAELLAHPRKTESFLMQFFSDTGISIDWSMEETVWRTAGRAYARYAKNRRRQKAGIPRRILADFVIGAHALENRYSLLTADSRVYRTAFPKLRLLSI